MSMYDYVFNDLVDIPAGKVTLTGELVIPEKAKGLIIFSHGSGSSRLSPRNTFVANILQSQDFATLMLDLLTREEDLIYENRFNIDLLSDRLIAATHWIYQRTDTKGLNIGYFGASTGAASALIAASKLGDKIQAIVSRGGRPDMAINHLTNLSAPTLLIIGGLDYYVRQLNEQAYAAIPSEKRIIIIPGASHLFEEPGKLEEVASLAGKWFRKYLSKEEKVLI